MSRRAAPPAWLVELERALGEDADEAALATAIVVLASVAGEEVAIPESERRAATRRATLLLVAGGDPARGLDLHGRAVSALADELRDVDRQIALETAVKDLVPLAAGLPHASEALRGLVAAPEIAWRAFACSLLAEDLAEQE